MKAQDLSNIIVWGQQNEEKNKGWMKWDHDYMLFATYKDKLSVLSDPAALIPVIFDQSADSLESKELYDGVFEYKSGDLTVEMVDGVEYSEYKIYSASFDENALFSRLKSAGATQEKPEIPIEIPDRPGFVNIEDLNKQRYNYKQEYLDKDNALAKSETMKSIAKNSFTFLFVGLILAFVGYEVMVPKVKDVTPDPENFITAEGNIIVYNVDGRMTTFKIHEDVTDIGYDSTFSIMIPEDADVRRNVIVDRLVSPTGEVIYNRGSVIVDFEPDPKDYGFVNSNPFVFDGYNTNGEEDWSQYGELERGEAEKVIFRGRITEVEGKYVMILGRVYAVLGDANEETQPFYELLQDDVSKAAVLFSLKAEKPIALYGQIQKTLTRAEGRNSVQKMVFTFKTDYARQR